VVVRSETDVWHLATTMMGWIGRVFVGNPEQAHTLPLWSTTLAITSSHSRSCGTSRLSAVPSDDFGAPCFFLFGVDILFVLRGLAVVGVRPVMSSNAANGPAAKPIDENDRTLFSWHALRKQTDDWRVIKARFPCGFKRARRLLIDAAERRSPSRAGKGYAQLLSESVRRDDPALTADAVARWWEHGRSAGLPLAVPELRCLELAIATALGVDEERWRATEAGAGAEPASSAMEEVGNDWRTALGGDCTHWRNFDTVLCLLAMADMKNLKAQMDEAVRAAVEVHAPAAVYRLVMAGAQPLEESETEELE